MRLIDGTRIEQFILNNCSDTEEINTIYAELINAPTIDAVPVVRCGECNHSGTDGENTFCMWLGALRKPTDFCSYGERKE